MPGPHSASDAGRRGGKLRTSFGPEQCLPRDLRRVEGPALSDPERSAEESKGTSRASAFRARLTDIVLQVGPAKKSDGQAGVEGPALSDPEHSEGESKGHLGGRLSARTNFKTPAYPLSVATYAVPVFVPYTTDQIVDV